MVMEAPRPGTDDMGRSGKTLNRVKVRCHIANVPASPKSGSSANSKPQWEQRTFAAAKCARNLNQGNCFLYGRGQSDQPEACYFRGKLNGRSFYSSLTSQAGVIPRRRPRGQLPGCAIRFSNAPGPTDSNPRNRRFPQADDPPPLKPPQTHHHGVMGACFPSQKLVQSLCNLFHVISSNLHADLHSHHGQKFFSPCCDSPRGGHYCVTPSLFPPRSDQIFS
jgi:hypothetical protein